MPLFCSFKISFQRNPKFYALMREFAFQAPAVSVIANLVCLGLTYLSMVINSSRKSFLA
jgi:hypothetical protein